MSRNFRKAETVVLVKWDCKKHLPDRGVYGEQGIDVKIYGGDEIHIDWERVSSQVEIAERSKRAFLKGQSNKIESND